MTVQLLDVLRAFRKLNGKLWKAKLRELWMQGGDAEAPELRQLRNIVGAGNRRLEKIEAAHRRGWDKLDQPAKGE